MLTNDYEALSKKSRTGELSSPIIETFISFYSSLTNCKHEVLLTENSSYFNHAKQQLDIVKTKINNLTTVEKYSAFLQWNQYQGATKKFFFSRLDLPNDYKLLNNLINALNVFLLKVCLIDLMKLAYEGKTTKSNANFNYFLPFQLSASNAGALLTYERGNLFLVVENEIKHLQSQDKSLYSTKLAIEILEDFFNSTATSPLLKVNYYSSLRHNFDSLRHNVLAVTGSSTAQVPPVTIPPINASRTPTVIVDFQNNIKFALIDNRYNVFRKGSILLIPQHAELTNESVSTYLSQSFTASLNFFNQLASNPTPFILMKPYTPLEVPMSMLSASLASNSNQFTSYFGY